MRVFRAWRPRIAPKYLEDLLLNALECNDPPKQGRPWRWTVDYQAAAVRLTDVQPVR